MGVPGEPVSVAEIGEPFEARLDDGFRPRGDFHAPLEGQELHAPLQPQHRRGRAAVPAKTPREGGNSASRCRKRSGGTLPAARGCARPPRAPLPAPGWLGRTRSRPQAAPSRRSPVTATARAPPPSTPITCISGRPSRFVENTISAPSGDHARIALVPVVVPREPEGDATVRRQQEQVVAAPDVGGEGDQAAVRGDRRTGAESGLLDMEFAVIVRSLDAEDPAGSGMVGARRNRDQEAAGKPSPKPGPGSGWISFEPPPHTRMSSPPGATARMSKLPEAAEEYSTRPVAVRGWKSIAGWRVSRSGAPPSAATRQMSRFPSRSREKTSERPSGAQSGSKS